MFELNFASAGKRIYVKLKKWTNMSVGLLRVSANELSTIKQVSTLLCRSVQHRGNAFATVRSATLSRQFSYCCRVPEWRLRRGAKFSDTLGLCSAWSQSLISVRSLSLSAVQFKIDRLSRAREKQRRSSDADSRSSPVSSPPETEHDQEYEVYDVIEDGFGREFDNEKTVTGKDLKQSGAAKSDHASASSRGVLQKYKTFVDDESPVIYDVHEEDRMAMDGIQFDREPRPDPQQKFAGISLERGRAGVFDIEQLVDILCAENAKDVCVVTVDPSMKYVDYLVFVSGKSVRHMKGMAEFILRVYKAKMNRARDRVPQLEGDESTQWMAVDLGNIALHIMTAEARRAYDIEGLWAMGAAHDEHLNQPDDGLLELLKQHTVMLGDGGDIVQQDAEGQQTTIKRKPKHTFNPQYYITSYKTH